MKNLTHKIKDFTYYSRALQRLSEFLSKNQHNLDRYSLVKPYRMSVNLGKKYAPIHKSKDPHGNYVFVSELLGSFPRHAVIYDNVRLPYRAFEPKSKKPDKSSKVYKLFGTRASDLIPVQIQPVLSRVILNNDPFIKNANNRSFYLSHNDHGQYIECKQPINKETHNDIYDDSRNPSDDQLVENFRQYIVTEKILVTEYLAEFKSLDYYNHPHNENHYHRLKHVYHQCLRDTKRYVKHQIVTHRWKKTFD